MPKQIGIAAPASTVANLAQAEVGGAWRIARLPWEPANAEASAQTSGDNQAWAADTGGTWREKARITEVVLPKGRGHTGPLRAEQF